MFKLTNSFYSVRIFSGQARIYLLLSLTNHWDTTAGPHPWWFLEHQYIGPGANFPAKTVTQYSSLAINLTMKSNLPHSLPVGTRWEIPSMSRMPKTTSLDSSS